MKITLALGGGGAKGNSHLGVIRRLEREGFEISAIAGTSFGGIVAILYSAGYPINEIENIFSRVDQKRLYGRERTDGPSLMGLMGVRSWLDQVVGERTFDDLKIPCAVTAVDMHSSREVILSKGRLKDVLLATIAVPGIFPAFYADGLELVDGGVLDPVPVSVARSLKPNLPVVAVVLSQPLGAPVKRVPMPAPPKIPFLLWSRIIQSRFAQMFDNYMRSVEIGGRQMTELRLKLDAPEVIIRPSVEHIDLLDLVDVHEVAQLGDEAVEAELSNLVKLMPLTERIRRNFIKVRT